MSKIAYVCGYGEKNGKLSGISRCAQSIIRAVSQLDRENVYQFWGNDELDVPVERIHTIYTKEKDRLCDAFAHWYQADIIHSLWAPLFAAKGKCQNIITIYDLCPLVNIEWYDNQRGIYQFYDEWMRGQLQYADKIIAISETTKSDILSYYPTIREKDVEVIYLGNESALDARFYKGDITSERYNIKSGYILSVNTMVKRKNIEGTIQAFELYHARHPKSELKLVLTGRWEKTNRVLERAFSSSIRDKIVLTGYVSDAELLSLYYNADCVMYPSFYEGFGLPVLEAMTLGKAVITSNISSMPEVGGDAVHYCDPYDIESIADGIEKICEGETYRQALEQKAVLQAAKFSYHRAAQETVDLYSRMLS